MFTSAAIANYFLACAKAQAKQLTPMQIQKLVYFAHGWNLALFETPLIDEKVEAWKYGPVIPSLYQEFKRFGNGPILTNATEWSFRGQEPIITEPSILEGAANQEEFARTEALLDRVWEVYGDFTGIQMSRLTHEPGTPWDETWKTCQGRKNVDIDDELIKAHFKAKINEPAA